MGTAATAGSSGLAWPPARSPLGVLVAPWPPPLRLAMVSGGMLNGMEATRAHQSLAHGRGAGGPARRARGVGRLGVGGDPAYAALGQRGDRNSRHPVVGRRVRVDRADVLQQPQRLR